MKAVIFDLDGTLIDLFDLHYEGFRHVAEQELGAAFERADFEEQYGKTGEEIFRAFLAKRGLKGDPQALAKKRRPWVVDHIRSCKILPGARELLAGLNEAGCAVALGTSSSKDVGEAVMEECGLGGFFRFKVYRTPELRSKPAPDIFLAAAAGLGARPGECVVVEDSTHGVAAAKAAGMKVVAVATGAHTRGELEAQKPDILALSLVEVGVSRINSLFGK
jgi:HAD superfamily hydrolase (TIGR01509 family)